MTQTHTFVVLELSESAYEEIASKLRAAGHEHAFANTEKHGTVIDMNGLAVGKEKKDEPKPDPNCERCNGKGYITWSSMIGTWPNQRSYAAGRDDCDCVKTDAQRAKEAAEVRNNERIC